MYRRAFLFVTLVVLGAVLPYFLADDTSMADLEGWWTSLTSTKAEVDAPRPPAALTANYATRSIGLDVAVQPPLEAAAVPPWGGAEAKPRVVGPSLPLEQLLSFDITPEWVSGNWSRISTHVADLDLQGWRVPVALGPRPADLAGSITYCFDSEQRLQRILLHGYLADPIEMVRLAETRYSMRPRPSPEGELYVANIEGKPLGALRLKFAAVMRAEVPGKRCEVLLELNRVATQYGMSREFQRALRAAGVATPESAQGSRK